MTVGKSLLVIIEDVALSSKADNDVFVEVTVCRLCESDAIRLFSVLNYEL